MAPFTSRLPFDLSCWLSLCAKFIFIATVYENLIIVIGNSSPCIKALCSVLKSQYSEIAVGVQSLSHVLLFVTPWTTLHQASCPLLSPRVCWNSYPLIWWCHPTILSSVVPFSFCLQSLPTSGSFQMSQFLTSGDPKYWSFSFNISPSSEYSGLISFRIDWFDLLGVQGILKSLL